MAFQHDIAGGNGNLVVTAVKSPNFVHGVSGWSINRDGSAEFHTISIPAGSGGAVITFASTAPSSPHVGDIWYDTSNGLLEHQWNGSSWAPFQIGTGAIASGAITTPLIANAAITNALIASAAVGTANIANGAVTATQIAAAAGILGTQLANGTITGTQLNTSVTARSLGGITTTISGTAPGSPVTGDLWINSASGFQLNQWTGSAWSALSWNAANVLSAATITGSLIAASTITGGNIAAGTITASNIAAGTITASQIAAGTIVGSLIAANAITTGLIAAGAVTATQIAANTITAGNIAANTITAGQIAANSITEATLAAWAVDGVISQAAFHGLNMIPDPQFSNSGVSTARTSDPVTAGSWTLSGGQAQAVNSASAANILALMSSTAKPIWVNPGETYYYSVTVSRSGASVNQIGVQFLGSTTITKGTTAAGTNTLSGTFTIPAGWSQMYVRIFANTSATADTITWSSPVLQPATLFSPVITGGTFNGTNWIENSTGSFFYSGTPAANNLIQSESNTQGQDGSGNYFLSGNTSYVPQGGGYIAIQNSAGAINFWFAAAMVSASNPWTALGNIAPFNGSPNLLQIASGPNAGDYIGLAGPVKVTGGFHYSGPAVAYHPGGTTDETWQNITLDAGWTSVVTPQYRLLPDGLVAVRGQATHAGTTAATNINNSNPIPSAYWPTANRIYRPPVAGDSAGTVQISSTGVFAMRASGFTATQVFMDGIYSI